MPIRRDACAARRGISLLEAVVGITIVGITSVAALEAVGSDLRTAGKARRAIEAEALAASRVDFMNLYGYNTLESIPDSAAHGTFAAPLDEYTWKTSSTPLSDQAGVFDVRVTVAWSDGSYALRTYLYRTPPLASVQ